MTPTFLFDINEGTKNIPGENFIYFYSREILKKLIHLAQFVVQKTRRTYTCYNLGSIQTCVVQYAAALFTNPSVDSFSAF